MRDLDCFRSFARNLDARSRVPGVPFRIGFDGLLELIPGVGDFITGVMGLYAVKIAADHRLPWWGALQILFNLGLDTVLGAVPLLGDLFDFAFHAHRRNLALLEKHLHRKIRGRD